MKKIIFTLLCFAIFIPACKERNDLQGKEFMAYSFKSGGHTTSFGGYIPTTDVYKVYRFLSDTKVERCSRADSLRGRIVGDIDTGTYEIEYPNIKFTFVTKYDVEPKEGFEPFVLDTSIVNGSFIDPSTFRIGDKEFILQK